MDTNEVNIVHRLAFTKRASLMAFKELEEGGREENLS